MLTGPDDLRVALDVIGIFAFAVSGGLVGVRARLDLFGVAVLAWLTGLGGGVVRDVFLGDVPPVGISDPRSIITVLVAGLVVVGVRPWILDLTRRNPDLRLGGIGSAVRHLDAVGLAVFAVAGALKAVALGAPPLACVFVGGITAVGGGAIRDVLVGQVPEVLRREVYAVPAVLGAALVVVADQLGMLTTAVIWSTVVLVFVIRVAAIHLDLNIPTAPQQGARP
ncbi:trimeric intracellular cation channel family protein [Ornithinimicrobium avium]|uniref:Trimeric intracellular cation channel family protein n=1 Tax=Ornithinimicrobium avium TaxID=2283195 RepID=A0A345NK23_9MICO|nr:trimeric intracellular cation channel family protein [Ornithinimicrobium avium]AXH95381.1 trimeric intracellular cation channel family protein [Ornithinimicrobium avium]